MRRLLPAAALLIPLIIAAPAPAQRAGAADQATLSRLVDQGTDRGEVMPAIDSKLVAGERDPFATTQPLPATPTVAGPSGDADDHG